MRNRVVIAATLITLLATAASLVVSGTSQAARGTRAAFSDLKVGQTVSVGGKTAGPRALAAAEIDIIEATGVDLVRGVAQNVDADSLMIGSVKVVATGATRIFGAEGRPIEFASLKGGTQVQVRGQARPDRTFQASQIKVKTDPGYELEIESKVQGIDAGNRRMTVMGFTVHVSQSTKIRIK